MPLINVVLEQYFYSSPLKLCQFDICSFVGNHPFLSYCQLRCLAWWSLVPKEELPLEADRGSPNESQTTGSYLSQAYTFPSKSGAAILCLAHDSPWWWLHLLWLYLHSIYQKWSEISGICMATFLVSILM